MFPTVSDAFQNDFSYGSPSYYRCEFITQKQAALTFENKRKALMLKKGAKKQTAKEEREMAATLGQWLAAAADNGE